MTHLLPIIIVVVIILFALQFSKKRFQKTRTRVQPSQNGAGFIPQSNDWLDRVSSASFSRQPIMNKGEYLVFQVAEKIIRAHCQGYRVFAQTSLGEILRCEDRETFRAINSKRVDIVIVDRIGVAVVAIEFQGSGHYQKNAPMRDAIKKEALRRAGIPTVEITSQDDTLAIETKIRLCLSTTQVSDCGNIPVNQVDN